MKNEINAFISGIKYIRKLLLGMLLCMLILSGLTTEAGDTIASIAVKPVKYFSYLVRVTNRHKVDRDSANISVKVSLPECGGSGIVNNDTTVCPKTVLQLNAKPAFSYQWFPSQGLNDTTIQNPSCLVDTNRTYYLISKMVSDNLITNGSFEQGNTGFNTTYTNCNTNNCLFPLANNGYSVGKDASFYHSLFQGKDHTSGAGNFMVINGADPNLTVWKKTVNIKSNTDYAFGVWISTMIVRNTAKIRFSVNGAQLGPIFNAPQELNKWVQVFTTWNSGANSTATIEIVDTYNEPNGNDFGLDDIFFGEVINCTDSINIKTTLLPPVNISTAICAGSTYTLPSGIIKSATGVFKDTLRNTSGCDSLITTVNLTVYAAAINTEASAAICSGQPYTLPLGTIVNASGVYRDTLKNSLGCDSLITMINLTISGIINNDTTFCIGTEVQLNASPAVFYKWYPHTGISDATLQNPILNADASRKYYLESGVYSQNMVINGNFEKVNTFFSSDYTYCDEDDCLYAEGFYTVGKDANYYHDSLSGKDHTTGNGNFMIVNGAGVANTIIFKQTIAIKPNTDYYFSTWISSVADISPADIQFQINGKTIGKIFKAPAAENKWENFFISWNSGTATSAIITILNQNTEIEGNDFGLDDIFFGEIVLCKDSINITVPLKTSVTTNASICEGAAYSTPSGVFVTKAGIYNDTLKSAACCDSVLTTITLTVFTPAFSNLNALICPGQSFMLPSGTLVNTAGVYNDTVKNVYGCDSLISRVNLSMFNATFTNTIASVCFGQSYRLPSGKMINTAGIYKDTLKSATGCDSVITTTTLSVFSPLFITAIADICSGESYTLPSGAIASDTGVYQDTLKSKAGCDSLITTLTLNVFAPALINRSATICAGQLYTLPSGVILNTPGVYKDTIKSAAACDSLITTFTLTVLVPEQVNNNINICAGQSYTLPSGIVITLPGIYADTLKSKITGCDSLITIYNIFINDSSSSDVIASICLGQSYKLPSGREVNTAGVYVSTIKNSKGCDSVITTTLKYYPALSVKLNGPASICKGDQALLSVQASGGTGGPYNYFWSPSGNNNTDQLVISPAADTKIIVRVSDGCTLLVKSDSLILKVNPKPAPNFSLMPANGCVPLTVQFTNSTPLFNNKYTWDFGDGSSDVHTTSPSHIYINQGSYTVSLTAENANGCADSFKITPAVKASIKPVAAFKTSPFPNIIANSKIEFTDLSVGAASWLWAFGDGIGSSTQRDPTYIYKDTGTYTAMLVTATDNGCTDTAYSQIEIKGGSDIYIPNAFTPNGDGINDHFSVYAIGVQSVDMVIFNRWGEKVFEQKGNSPLWNGKFQEYGKDCSQGAYVYVIKAVDKNGKTHSLSGTVALLR